MAGLAWAPGRATHSGRAAAPRAAQGPEGGLRCGRTGPAAAADPAAPHALQVQHPLGNPKERELPGSEFPLCISTSARAPLAEIWSATDLDVADACSGTVGSPRATPLRRRSDPSELSQFLAGLGAKWQPPGFKGLQGRATPGATPGATPVRHVDGRAAQRGAGGGGAGGGGDGDGDEGGDEGGVEGGCGIGAIGPPITPKPAASGLVTPQAATATWGGADEPGAAAAAAAATATATVVASGAHPVAAKKADQAKLAAFLTQKYGAGGGTVAADRATSASDDEDDDGMMQCMSEKIAQQYGASSGKVAAGAVTSTGDDNDDDGTMQCMGEKTRDERDAELRSEAIYVDLEDTQW